jgi:hypothetical protein
MVQMGKVGRKRKIEVADEVLWRLLLLWSVMLQWAMLMDWGAGQSSG